MDIVTYRDFYVNSAHDVLVEGNKLSVFDVNGNLALSQELPSNSGIWIEEAAIETLQSNMGVYALNVLVHMLQSKSLFMKKDDSRMRYACQNYEQVLSGSFSGVLKQILSHSVATNSVVLQGKFNSVLVTAENMPEGTYRTFIQGRSSVHCMTAEAVALEASMLSEATCKYLYMTSD